MTESLSEAQLREIWRGLSIVDKLRYLLVAADAPVPRSFLISILNVKMDKLASGEASQMEQVFALARRGGEYKLQADVTMDPNAVLAARFISITNTLHTEFDFLGF